MLAFSPAVCYHFFPNIASLSQNKYNVQYSVGIKHTTATGTHFKMRVIVVFLFGDWKGKVPVSISNCTHTHKQVKSRYATLQPVVEKTCTVSIIAHVLYQGVQYCRVPKHRSLAPFLTFSIPADFVLLCDQSALLQCKYKVQGLHTFCIRSSKPFLSSNS